MNIMIDSEAVKTRRLEKSWSQEKLANASGLSLRTIQRVENHGNGSLETKLALAAVFDTEPHQLSYKSASVLPTKTTRKSSLRYGYIGAGFGFVCAYAGITLSVVQGGMSIGAAGLYYGSVGAFVGICCGLLSVLNHRHQRSHC